jgi:hypothetical protein
VSAELFASNRHASFPLPAAPNPLRHQPSTKPPTNQPNRQPPNRPKRLIQLELQRMGIKTDYRRMAVNELGDDVWRGIKNKYWKWPWYFLPVCVFEGKQESKR